MLQMALVVKNLPANARDIRDAGSIPSSLQGRSPVVGNCPVSLYPVSLSGVFHGQREEPGRLQTMGLQKSQT